MCSYYVCVYCIQHMCYMLFLGSGQMISIGEWLESIGMGQYENAFVANGYDNIDYLVSGLVI